MPRIISIGTAVPAHRIEQEEARTVARHLFSDAIDRLEALIKVFDHAGVQCRYSAAPLAWFKESHSLAEKNNLYIESARTLCGEAIMDCLSSQDLSPRDIDHLIIVSTTGISTPSLDAMLINQLDMRDDVIRTPIWGLGCAGGIGGLARAVEFAKARPDSRIVVVAVELCTLTLMRNDFSKQNLIATALFGDGAAAVLVAGDDQDGTGPSVIGHTATTWPDTLDVMGWDFGDGGFRVVLSKDIPLIVRDHISTLVTSFLDRLDLPQDSIAHYITHPGGPKVIEAYKQALTLTDDQVQHTWDVLRAYGNMSSPTVLFIMKRFLEQLKDQKDGYGLASAMGPGFTSEMLMLKWG